MLDFPKTVPVAEAEAGAPVLLVATTDLGANGIGALFLRDVMAATPEIQFVVHRELPFLLGGGTERLKKIASLVRSAVARLPRFHALRLAWFRGRMAAARAAAIAKMADRHGADRIWITASSPEMIWIGEHLAASGRDIRVMVWDGPEYLAGNLGLPGAMHQALLNTFGSLLRKAHGVSVIGSAMRADYEHRYSVKSEIIRHGINLSTCPERIPRSRCEALRIVFAGSLYSKEEWNSFIGALEMVDWTLGGQRVLLHFLGRFPLSGARKPARVIFLGERSFAEAQQILATMDIGYLPYWFAPDREIAARTSFPGKLSSYAAAGLAVFHHAPPYTETTSFLATYPFGVACASLNSRAVIDCLEVLIAQMDCPTYRQARAAALHDELSQAVMGERFRRFLSRRNL